MQRVVIAKPGDQTVLRLETGPDLMPGPAEVCVQVAATGVNFADIAIRLGLYESAKKYVGYPITPGFETAGQVVAAGPEALAELAQRGLTIGSQVIAVSRFFGYASQVLVPPHQVFALPPQWTAAQGAAFPVAFLTAWYGLHHLAHAKPADRVLVHSAAGGVGQALLQLARRRGCRTLGVVSSPAKLAVVQALGAEVAVATQTTALWPVVEAWAPEGVDIILDANGVDTLGQGYQHLAPAGRLVVYGHATMLDRGGKKTPLYKLAWRWLRTPRFNPLHMTTSNRSVLAFNLSFLFDHKDMLQDAMVDLLAGVADGQLQPLPLQTYPLTEVARAHLALESGTTTGKLVLLP